MNHHFPFRRLVIHWRRNPAFLDAHVPHWAPAGELHEHLEDDRWSAQQPSDDASNAWSEKCCQQCSWHKQRNINIWIKRVCGYVFEYVWKNRLCQTKSDSAPTGRWIKLTCTLSSMSCFVGTLETSRYISHSGNPAQDSSARTRSRFWLWHAPTMLKSHGQQK